MKKSKLKDWQKSKELKQAVMDNDLPRVKDLVENHQVSVRRLSIPDSNGNKMSAWVVAKNRNKNAKMAAFLYEAEYEETRRDQEKLRPDEIVPYIYPSKGARMEWNGLGEDPTIYYSFHVPSFIRDVQATPSKASVPNREMTNEEKEFFRKVINQEFRRLNIAVEEIALSDREIQKSRVGESGKKIIYITNSADTLEERYQSQIFIKGTTYVWVDHLTSKANYKAIISQKTF